jgi:cleavage and polyadenylation specificity factor subunit 1
MHALRQEILPPSGVEFATSLKLTPSTLADQVLPTPPNSSTRQELAARALCNVVVARTSLLRIFEVREDPAPVPTQAEDERDRRSKVRRGTEAVEGEVEMDEQGEGFVNMGSAKVIQNTCSIFRLHRMRDGFPALSCVSALRKRANDIAITFSRLFRMAPCILQLSPGSTSCVNISCTGS